MKHHTQSPTVVARAFTLIELLVVVAVIAILIGVLLPALGQARSAAYKIGGANTQRQLAIGAYTYGAENDNHFPSVGTSGEPLAGGRWELDDLSKDSARPVQSFDWMTPSLNPDDLPTGWAARFSYLLNELACPAQNLRFGAYGDGDQDALAEMEEYLFENGDGESNAPSFLMPLPMQVYGGHSVVQRISRTERRIIRAGQLDVAGGVTASQATIPEGHVPRLDNMKNASNKIFSADGIRYIDVEGGFQDFDPSIAPTYFGSFTTSTPIYKFATSYPTGDPAAWEIVKPFALRHNGLMNASFFDGSGRTLDENTMMDPALWYPSKSEFHTGGDTAEASSLLFGYEEGDLLN